MKCILFIFLLLCTVALVGCTKDTEPEKQINIFNVTPLKSKVNAQVDVTGSGFSQMVSQDSAKQIKVFIGTTQVHASIINDTLLQIWIPANTTSGVVCVEWNAKRYCSQHTYTIIPGNTVQNTFMRLPEFPGGFQTGFMFAIGTNIYVHDMQNLWRFGTETFQWAKVASPPERATSTATFVIDGKAYVFGGLTFSNGNGDNQLWQYDPQTNLWTIKTPMPATKRYCATAFEYNKKAYVAGGTVTSYGGNVSQEMWEYDPASDKWTRKQDLIEGVTSQSSYYQLGNKFYLQVYNGTLEYDPKTGTQRILQGYVPTKFSAIHTSNKWSMAYVVNSGGGSNSVQRIVLNANFSSIFSETVKYPIDPVMDLINPGFKYIQSYASIDGDLYFVINDYNARKAEFWEYLAE